MLHHQHCTEIGEWQEVEFEKQIFMQYHSVITMSFCAWKQQCSITISRRPPVHWKGWRVNTLFLYSVYFSWQYHFSIWKHSAPAIWCCIVTAFEDIPRHKQNIDNESIFSYQKYVQFVNNVVPLLSVSFGMSHFWEVTFGKQAFLCLAGWVLGQTLFHT